MDGSCSELGRQRPPAEGRRTGALTADDQPDRLRSVDFSRPSKKVIKPAAAPRTAGRSALRIRDALILLSPLVVGALALFFGVYRLTPAQVLDALAGVFSRRASPEIAVVLDIRLPRIALAGLTGMALAGSGATLQAVFRNPLVDPFLLGISAGAAFGCAIGVGFLPAVPIPLLAFAFGCLAVGCAFALARGGGGGTLSLVLSGVVVSAFLSALLSLVTLFVDAHNLQAIVFWLMGSLSLADWGQTRMAAIGVVLGLTPVVALRWRLNVLSLGDEEARALGVDVRLLRLVLIGGSTLAVASVVAVSGVIGWVGLMVPHLVRMIAGPEHRRLMPLALAGGAAYLIAADTAARSVTNFDVPVGIVTALVGAPFFVYLMARSRAAGRWER